MKRKIFLIFLALILLGLFGFCFCAKIKNTDDELFITYTISPKKNNIEFYWKDENHINFKSIQNLKNYLEKKNKKLLFAMNAGMYNLDNSPKGLFIQQKITYSQLDTTSGNGNFYLKPNGVFYITTDNVPVVCNTTDFIDNGNIEYATQSGPMLLIDGNIHEAFNKTSKNLNIRNGVGILPNDEVVFVMSKHEINFYDFATYFKSIGCKDALYLDGFVSRTYLPEKKWVQTDGDFGVIIGTYEIIK